MPILDDTFWSSRYEAHQTGWDLHKASPPLKAYADQWENKESRILIPGCGNAYEADYLWEKGFKHITLLDISSVLVEHLKDHFRDKPIRILHEDFFEHIGQYDLILEQTFLCAIDPALRKHYAMQMHKLLYPGGTLAGVLFNRQFEGGPPFGGGVTEYQQLFSDWFDIHTLENCYNSIEPRKGNEVFFIVKKIDKTQY
ncbi:MAG: TPMT family class I SAM-dependent methyltransferase [Chitinophagaceae bacterium]|jgi:SAM-dependent methyltransferase|nr:TPMT family class I SAM-dependent methyltransferase [Chitinophagaceae bacterium]